jgi:hypothetical protein
MAPNQPAAMMFFPHFLGDAQTRVNYGTRSALTLTAQTPIPRYDFVGPDRSAGLGT